MAQESEAECSVAADTIEALFCDVGGLVTIVLAVVAALALLVTQPY